MKVLPPSIEQTGGPSRATDVASDARPPQKRGGVSGRAERVELSAQARFVEGLRESAREDEPVRTAEVERIRAAIANGTYEASIDLDDVVNRLLGDL